MPICKIGKIALYYKVYNDHDTHMYKTSTNVSIRRKDMGKLVRSVRRETPLPRVKKGPL